jgi:hypothetical protein
MVKGATALCQGTVDGKIASRKTLARQSIWAQNGSGTGAA